MIEIIEDFDGLKEWKKRDLFSIRILALLKSYGTSYNFATFYRQIIDGKITAVISKLDNDITLALDGDFDNAELVRFFCITGHSSILCPNEFQFGAKYDEGAIMQTNKKMNLPTVEAIVDEYPKLMDLYNFIDYENQDFKSWYVDISHRVRHNTAKAYTLNVDGFIVSSGILSSIYDNTAVLSAVRTQEEFRNMGYASFLVSYICNDVKGSVFLMREANINESFYSRLGFENTEIWRMYR